MAVTAIIKVVYTGASDLATATKLATDPDYQAEVLAGLQAAARKHAHKHGGDPNVTVTGKLLDLS